MSAEVGRTSRLDISPDKLGLPRRSHPVEDFLDGIEDGIKPNGCDFVDMACDDPAVAATILDVICDTTGADPKDAIQVAELFGFQSAEEVEYFFATLT